MKAQRTRKKGKYIELRGHKWHKDSKWHLPSTVQSVT